MEESELRLAWQEHKAAQERERMEREADEAARPEIERRNAIIQGNANWVGKFALELTNVVGWSEDESDRFDILNLTRRSNPIPLGELDESGDTQAFARIYVKHWIDLEPVTTTRRLLKPKTESIIVPGETLEVGVRYYAGTAPDEDQEMFAELTWNRLKEDTSETLDAVEHELAELSERLGYQHPSE